MGKHWMLEVREAKGTKRAVIGKQPDLTTLTSGGFLNWLSGKRLDLKITTPLVFQLDPRAGGDVTDFFPPSIPLMSRRMLKGLESAGVTTLETYPATLLDRQGKPIPEEFRAVNIVGRIACADLEASDCVVDNPEDPVGVEFNSLVIDPVRAGEALLFRLHEAVNGIVVHDSVRKILEPLGLRGIVFVKPEEWIG